MTRTAFGNLATLGFPLLWVLISLSSAPARASLGGDAQSVAADSHLMRGAVATTATVQYDVQQIVNGALLVNEYLTRSGQVFAVTWHGPTPPNLQQLLGTYFSRFQAAAAAAHRNNPGIHRHFTLSQPDLVVQNFGRLRDFRGIAYLPALVPEGVSVGTLK